MQNPSFSSDIAEAVKLCKRKGKQLPTSKVMWLQVLPFLMGGDFHATYVICHSNIP